MSGRDQWETAFIGLGSNLGDRGDNLRQALQRLDADPCITVTGVSSFHETEPWGRTGQPRFINAAARLSTSYEPAALMRRLLLVEREMGRRRTVRWGPRIIDLDLLIYGSGTGRKLKQPGLELPHPRMLERDFVCDPLEELAPGLAAQLREESLTLDDNVEKDKKR